MIEELLLTLWANILSTVPGIIAAILTLIIGFILGKIIGRVVREILVRAKIDEYIITEEKISFKFSNVFALIARWVIYLVFIQQAVMFLGVTAIIQFVNSILIFIPGLIAAALVIIIGYNIALYLKDKIVTSKTLYSDITGKTIFFLVVYLSIALALPFVGINPELINSILLIIIGSVGIGLAIALGLGLKDVIADTAKRYTKKFKK